MENFEEVDNMTRWDLISLLKEIVDNDENQRLAKMNTNALKELYLDLAGIRKETK